MTEPSKEELIAIGEGFDKLVEEQMAIMEKANEEIYINLRNYFEKLTPDPSLERFKLFLMLFFEYYGKKLMAKHPKGFATNTSMPLFDPKMN